MSDWHLDNKESIATYRYKGLERWYFTMPDGRNADFVMEVGGDIVIVFALTVDREVLLLREFFPSIQEKVITPVAGHVEVGDDPLDTAAQELKEEAGAVAEELILLGTVRRGKYEVPKVHFVFASGVSFEYEQALEGSEDIDVLTVSVEECRRLVYGSHIHGGYDVAAVLWGLDYLQEQSV